MKAELSQTVSARRIVGCYGLHSTSAMTCEVKDDVLGERADCVGDNTPSMNAHAWPGTSTFILSTVSETSSGDHGVYFVTLDGRDRRNGFDTSKSGPPSDEHEPTSSGAGLHSLAPVEGRGGGNGSPRPVAQVLHTTSPSSSYAGPQRSRAPGIAAHSGKASR